MKLKNTLPPGSTDFAARREAFGFLVLCTTAPFALLVELNCMMLVKMCGTGEDEDHG